LIGVGSIDISCRYEKEEKTGSSRIAAAGKAFFEKPHATPGEQTMSEDDNNRLPGVAGRRNAVVRDSSSR
jgi:hypothetical protein